MAALGSIGVNGQGGAGASSVARVYPIYHYSIPSSHRTTFRTAGGYAGHGFPVGNFFPTPIATVLPSGIVGTAYSGSVSAVGGLSPYTFSVSSGSLPTGLSLNSSTGAITGTPSAVGTSSFTIQATDSRAAKGSQSFAVTISAAATGANYGFVA